MSVTEHKKYVKDEKEVTKRGVETTIYVTAVDGIIKEYVYKAVSRPDLSERTCKNRHLGTLRQFERFWVNEKGYVEC